MMVLTLIKFNGLDPVEIPLVAPYVYERSEDYGDRQKDAMPAESSAPPMPVMYGRRSGDDQSVDKAS